MKTRPLATTHWLLAGLSLGTIASVALAKTNDPGVAVITSVDKISVTRST